MSVATRNPFALLEAEDSRPPTPAPKAPAPAPPPAAPPRSSQKSRGGPAARGGKYYARGGANKSASKDPSSTQNGVEDAAATEGQRMKFEGRGRGRGGRGGAQRGGRRPYDKHSQTGKTDSDKKIQQSWGGADGNTELKVEEAAAGDATAEANEWTADAGNTGDWDTPVQAATDAAPAAEGDKADGRPRKDDAEEEDNTLTLDQYLAQQKDKESVIPKLDAARQANEGADSNLWKDVVPLAKGEGEDSYYVGKAKAAPKAQSAPKTRAKKEEKQYIEIDARFERPDRGGRGRGRGGERGRGGRGRGAARGGRPTPAPLVSVDDETAFPSLS